MSLIKGPISGFGKKVMSSRLVRTGATVATGIGSGLVAGAASGNEGFEWAQVLMTSLKNLPTNTALPDLLNYLQNFGLDLQELINQHPAHVGGAVVGALTGLAIPKILHNRHELAEERKRNLDLIEELQVAKKTEENLDHKHKVTRRALRTMARQYEAVVNKASQAREKPALTVVKKKAHDEKIPAALHQKFVPKNRVSVYLNS